MSVQKYRRLDLAMNQFEMAVALFLAKKDYFSVITLAGAADVTFNQMVSRGGNENFTESLVKHEEAKRTKEDLGREVNDLFFINQLKHFDPGDPDKLSFNPYECACGAILKAMVNYNLLGGKNPHVVKDFLAWVKGNLDPKIYNVNCDPYWKPSE